MTFTLLCGRVLIPYACSGSYTHNRVRHFRSFFIDYVPHMKRKIRCDFFFFFRLNVYSATPGPLVKCSPLMLTSMLLTQRPTQHMMSLGIVCFCGDTKVKESRKKQSDVSAEQIEAILTSEKSLYQNGCETVCHERG